MTGKFHVAVLHSNRDLEESLQQQVKKKQHLEEGHSQKMIIRCQNRMAESGMKSVDFSQEENTKEADWTTSS